MTNYRYTSFPKNTYREVFQANHTLMKKEEKPTDKWPSIGKNWEYDSAVSQNNLYLTKFAQKKLCFSYSDLSYQDFVKLYKKQNSLGRKISALPKALWSLSKAIINIVRAVFGCSKLRRYHALRDLQAAYGHLISPFHETKGAYWTERSAFHKACYEAHAGNLDGSSSGSAPVAPESAKKLSLKEFTSQTEKEREIWIENNLNFIQGYYLKGNIKKFEKKLDCSLSEREKEVDTFLLEKIHLDDLFLSFYKSKVKFIFMSPEKLKKMTQETLSKLNPNHPGQLGITFYRLRQLAKTESHSFTYTQHPKRPLIEFAHFSREQIKNQEASLPSYAFGVFTVAQFKNIVFTKLSAEQRSHLYCRGGEELAEIFKQFTDKDLIQAIQENKLWNQLYRYLPEKIRCPSGETQEQIEKLFSSNNFQKNKEFLPYLSAKFILQAIEKGTLQAPELLALISDTQLQEIGAQLKEIPDYLSKCLTEKQIEQVNAGVK